jgi:hypothetical protein
MLIETLLHFQNGQKRRNAIALKYVGTLPSKRLNRKTVAALF